jgi:hypothetical protein
LAPADTKRFANYQSRYYAFNRYQQIAARCAGWGAGSHSRPVVGYAMPGRTEKSRQYLELATKNEKRASEIENPELKAIYLELAAAYRELAEQADAENDGRR